MNIELTPIESIADRVVDAYRKTLSNEGINASSTLSDTTQVAVEIKNGRLIISLMLQEYWKWVEYGRKYGKNPPSDAILEWIKVKPVIPNPINGRIPSQKQLAFLIARKIGRDGTQPRHAINKTVYNDEMENILEDIRNEVIRQLKQQLLGS
jgi:hypothetical protein